MRKTDLTLLSIVIKEFEEKLPGFWWSIGQCEIGAHASCGLDIAGPNGHLMPDTPSPLDSGFHHDTDKGQPDEALSQVMHGALEYLKCQTPPIELS